MRTIDANTVRRQVRAEHAQQSYADIGRDLGLSDEFVRMVLLGQREPSKAFLKATGYERVVRYRKVATINKEPISQDPKTRAQVLAVLLERAAE